MSKKFYKKLGGSESFSLFHQFRLFLGEDHLLIQKSTSFTHAYQRFYLKDIQSVYMVATRTQLLWSLFWGIQCGIAGVVLGMGDYPIATAVWLVLSILGLVVVLVRGKSCKTFLETATQTVKLPGLKRQVKTQQILDQLKRAIEGVQGRLSESESDLDMASEVPTVRRDRPTPSTSPSLWHVLHFALWLANAVLLGWIYLKGRSSLMMALYILVAVMTFGTAIVAMVGAIRRRQQTDPLAWATYAGFGLVVVRGVVAYIFIVFLAAMEQMTGTADLMRFALQGDFLDHKNYQIWLDIEVVISLFMGLIGTLLCVSNFGASRSGGTP